MLPDRWLMTDPRLGDDLIGLIAGLPRGVGVIFRHYAVPDRRALFEAVRTVCRRQRRVIILSGSPRQAQSWGADGFYGLAGGPLRGRRRRAGQIHAAPVHDAREIAIARRAGADLLLLSPVFPTRTHPGAPALGPIRFAALVRLARRAYVRRAGEAGEDGVAPAGQIAGRAEIPVIALGGMDARRGRRLRALGAAGWAAIDGWRRD